MRHGLVRFSGFATRLCCCCAIPGMQPGILYSHSQGPESTNLPMLDSMLPVRTAHATVAFVLEDRYLGTTRVVLENVHVYVCQCILVHVVSSAYVWTADDSTRDTYR